MLLKPLTIEEIEKHSEKNKTYYDTDRLKLFERVANLAMLPETVLEVGGYLMPLFPEGDTMDLHDHSVRGGKTPTYIHDAGKVPWPIKTCSYELVIGLQVWEHLGKVDDDEKLSGWFDQIQAIAFREIHRVAKGGRAILSFPFHSAASDVRHALCNEETIRRWTCFYPAVHSEVVGPRIIKIFEF